MNNSSPHPTVRSLGNVVAMILAGGRGSRLSPLTDYRPKPAIPIAGHFRLIDVALTNLHHSGLRDVWIVEQYLPGLLNSHLAGGRPWDLDGTHHGLRIVPPSQGDIADGFSKGNGHALYQQLESLDYYDVDTLLVMSADHLYHLDYSEVLQAHAESDAEVTVVTTEFDGDVSRYGVISTDDAGRITAYDYKPKKPATNVVSTEIFVFDVGVLRAACNALTKGGNLSDSDGSELGDYGDTILPYLVEHNIVREFSMEGYWRDVGTIDSYFQAHMDFIDRTGLDLDRSDWPMLTNPGTLAPARIENSAEVNSSLVSPGAVISGRVEHSVIGPGVKIEKGAIVRRSVLLGDTTVPSGAVLDSVVADRHIMIEAEDIGVTKPGPGNITVLSREDG